MDKTLSDMESNENQRIVPDLEEYKILIVDDVMSNILLLKALLKTQKYNIITANNGEEALQKVETDAPDLILLDVMMPGLNGFEVAKILQDSASYSHIPIIFLTALNSHEDVVKGFEFGANDFISKPFNKNELLARVFHQISLVDARRTILKQTEELRSIIAGRDKLYSVIAHDLRGPLGSIKMVLNLLLANIDNKLIGSDMFDMLIMANQTTEDVFTLLDNLLKWTKSQLGRVAVASSNFNLADIVNDSIDIFRTTAELKKITLNFDPSKTCDVFVDTDMVKTVMRNLLSNAIKYSNESSAIEIDVDLSDEKIAIVSVKDTGRGIKEEDKYKLLKEETHFSTFGTNNEEGSGLGLLLCVDFAKRNGGALWFESTYGQGSTFYFSVLKTQKEEQLDGAEASL